MKASAPAAAALCLALAGCRVLSPPKGPVDPALVAYLPPDTAALLGVQMNLLRQAPLYRKLAQQGRLSMLDGFRAETGIDPDRDVRQLLLASDGSHALALARGIFKPNPPDGWHAAAYRGCTLWAKDSGVAVAFPDNSTAIGGPDALVRAAIDRRKDGHRAAPADLLARAAALPPDIEIWAVVAGWSKVQPGTLSGNLANLDRVLRSVDGASLTVSFRAGFGRGWLSVIPSSSSATGLPIASQSGAASSRARISASLKRACRASSSSSGRPARRSTARSGGLPSAVR